MSDVVDLDVFEPKAATLKFDGNEIQVQPPRVSYLLRLGTLSSRLGELNHMTEEDIETAVDELKEHIYKGIPELRERPLSLKQIQLLTSMFNAMAIPEEKEALTAKGITSDGSDPKDQ